MLNDQEEGPSAEPESIDTADVHSEKGTTEDKDEGSDKYIAEMEWEIERERGTVNGDYHLAQVGRLGPRAK